MSSSTIPLFNRCPKCNQEKPFTTEFFHRDKTAKYGLSYACKECAKAKTRRWSADNKEYSNRRSREYAAAHRDEATERVRRWYKEHREYAREWHKRNYRRIKPKHLEQGREWAKRNPDQAKAIKRRYIENDPDRRRSSANRYVKSLKGRAARQRRRALERLAPGTHNATDLAALYDEQEGRCGYCGITLHGDYHVDHRQPLIRGGANSPDNLALSCEGCNLSKGAKTAAEWLAVRGW